MVSVLIFFSTEFLRNEVILCVGDCSVHVQVCANFKISFDFFFFFARSTIHRTVLFQGGIKK